MTEGERMLNLIRNLGPRRELTRVRGALSEECLVVLALALRFSQAPAAFRFRAIAEEWDRLKIVQELF